MLYVNIHAQQNDTVIKTYPEIPGPPFPIIEVFNIKEDKTDKIYHFYLNKFSYTESSLFKVLKEIHKNEPTQRFRILYDPNEKSEKITFLKDMLENIGFKKVTFYKVLDLKSKFYKNTKVDKNTKERITEGGNIPPIPQIVLDFIDIAGEQKRADLDEKHDFNRIVKLYQDFFKKYENQKKHNQYKIAEKHFKIIKTKYSKEKE